MKNYHVYLECSKEVYLSGFKLVGVFYNESDAQNYYNSLKETYPNKEIKMNSWELRYKEEQKFHEGYRETPPTGYWLKTINIGSVAHPPIRITLLWNSGVDLIYFCFTDDENSIWSGGFRREIDTIQSAKNLV